MLELKEEEGQFIFLFDEEESNKDNFNTQVVWAVPRSGLIIFNIIKGYKAYKYEYDSTNFR